MKQKLTVLAMVAMAALFIATPVLAAGSSRTMEVAKRTPTILSMTATITKLPAISTASQTGTIYVRIYMTNRAFIQYRGQSAEVEISDNTVCLKWANKRKSRLETMACSELGYLDKVSVIARVDPESKEITARRVLLSQKRIRH